MSDLYRLKMGDEVAPWNEESFMPGDASHFWIFCKGIALAWMIIGGCVLLANLLARTEKRDGLRYDRREVR